MVPACSLLTDRSDERFLSGDRIGSGGCWDKTVPEHLRIVSAGD